MRYAPYIWRSLWRKPIRTLLTFVSILIAFILLAMALGLEGHFHQMVNSASADRIHISARFNGTLRLTQLKQISKIRGVTQVVPLDTLSGYYRRPDNRIAILMVTPAMRHVFPRSSLSARQWTALRQPTPNLFASKLFASRYGLKPGSSLQVTAPGTPKADGSDLWRLKVQGVVPDLPLMPAGFAVGSYEYLQHGIPQTDRGAVQQIWVIAKPARDAPAVALEIDRVFAGSSFPTRSVSEKSSITSAGGGFLLTLMGISVLGMLAILLVTANALGYAIRERTTEIAVLKTLGFSNVLVAGLFLGEASIPCLSGCLAGLAGAAGLAAAMPVLASAGVALPLPRMTLAVISAALGAAILLALLASILPISRILRLDVADALARR